MTLPMSNRVEKPFLSKRQSFQEREGRGLNFSRFQSLGAGRTVADAVKNLVIAVAHQAFSGQAFDGGKFRYAAGAGDAHDLAFEIVDAVDSFGADERVIHVGLHSTDDEHGRVLRDRTNRGHTGDQSVVHAASDQGGHGCRSACDKNRSYVQTFGGKKAKILRDDERQRAAQRRRVGGEVDGLGGGDAMAHTKSH